MAEEQVIISHGGLLMGVKHPQDGPPLLHLGSPQVSTDLESRAMSCQVVYDVDHVIH